MENLGETINLFLSGASAVGVLFIVYNHFRRPDIQAAQKLLVNEAACNLRHQRVDEKFRNIDEAIILIKDNHLKHIENDVASIRTDVAILLDRQKRESPLRHITRDIRL